MKVHSPSKKFELTTDLTPKGDQQQAINKLVANLNKGVKHQVLLGATGTGKTFTIANVIAKTQKKTLVIVHNKTLAGQLYSEFKELFKNNKVEYYISYFDFYQPEAYLPTSDTYIEKSSKVNQEIEMLRLSTIQSLSTEDKVIVIASVAAIYPAVDPKVFDKYRIILNTGSNYNLKQLQYDLVRLAYKRNDVNLEPGCFKVKGDVVEIMEGSNNQERIRISFFGNEIEQIAKIDVNNNTVKEIWKAYVIYPANEYVADATMFETSLARIAKELKERQAYFKKHDKLLEHQRITERTNRDIETLAETGFCPGVENYAMHLELRQPGSTPYTIFDYLGDDWLLVVDEAHMTIPQIRGMYFGDRSRKQTLVDYGFRLPSALDNRPLNFKEFESRVKQAIYVSATPGDYEKQKSKNLIVEQIVRPTGLVDPVIQIKPTTNQILTLCEELDAQIKRKERTIVTVLTIKMAENLTKFLKEKKYKVAYLHNELKTFERDKVINALRKGIYDVVVGINLLREGLDVPEVSCAVIFDADKPGIFRSRDALIQTFGRTARNKNAHVLLFADSVNDALLEAINETNRRRKIQLDFNKKHHIVPKTIVKAIREDLHGKSDAKTLEAIFHKNTKITEKAGSKAIKKLQKKMQEAAKNQEYELAAHYRDLIIELEGKLK